MERVFITENEINGLAFPEVPGSLVIFGLGYGLDRLSECRWLGDRAALLGRHRHLRLPHPGPPAGAAPAAHSFLMDRETLLEHATLWVRESNPYDGELPRLTSAEGALYDDLRYNRLGERVRLEQERIPYGWLQKALLETAE